MVPLELSWNLRQLVSNKWEDRLWHGQAGQKMLKYLVETERDGVVFTLLRTLFKLKVVNHLLLEFSISNF